MAVASIPSDCPLLAFIRKRFSYVAVMGKGPAMPGTDKHKQLLTDTVRSISESLKTVRKINCSDGEVIQTLLLGSDLHADDKHKLMDEINHKVDIGGGCSTIAGGKQNNLAIETMMLHTDWLEIVPTDVPYRKKLMQMANVFLRLRITHGNEKTYSYGVCIAGLTEAPLEVSVQLGRISLLKELVRQCSQNVVKGPKDYVSVEHLKEHEPELYNDMFPRPPAPCPFDETTLKIATGTIRCRKPKGAEQIASSMISLHRQMQKTLALTAGDKGRDEDELLPGLQIFNGQKKRQLDERQAEQLQRSIRQRTISFGDDAADGAAPSPPPFQDERAILDLPAPVSQAAHFGQTPRPALMDTPVSPNTAPTALKPATPDTPPPRNMSFGSVTAMIQDKLKKVTAAPGDINEDDDDSTDDVQKKPAAICTQKIATTPKKKIAATKATKTPVAKVKQTASGSDDALKFKKNTKANFPRYYKNLKVYLDVGRKVWRIHQQGVKVDLCKIYFTTCANSSELEAEWSTVVAYVRKHAA